MLADLDIDAEAFQHNPYPWYALMRRQAPVFPVPGRDWTFVTTMPLVREVLADPATYSSRTNRQTDPPPEVRAEVDALRRGRPPSISVLVGNDPPAHGRYRRMANRAFTPRAVARLEPVVLGVVRELVRELPAEGDFVAHFAAPLPVWTICEVLGLGAGYRESMARWLTALTATTGHRPTGEQWLRIERERAGFDHAMVAELTARVRRPGSDLLGEIVGSAALVAPPDEVLAVALGLVRQLVVAGAETTTRVLAEAVALLAAEPAEWEWVGRERGRAGLVFEEAVRLASPVQQMVRRTTRAVRLGGVELAAGSRLLVSFASANRDERVFAEPDRFWPGRPDLQRHIAFGHGVHACLGIGLARLEGELALHELAGAAGRLSVTPHEPAYLPGYLLRGRTTLPVRRLR
ncbi:cytochrome P450 [Crossiella cryophila]|uniref:Cytochrome P450 n=1 Tax=Crossiella cryophila TaxID=43355 RepID=A0A7W7CEC0_9PSEU|nr:cytochrome P450 [Crossiella cryophila]MBB4679603.1 cytochrome P450 [Crossiella cryophila]